MQPRTFLGAFLLMITLAMPLSAGESATPGVVAPPPPPSSSSTSTTTTTTSLSVVTKLILVIKDLL